MTGEAWTSGTDGRWEPELHTGAAGRPMPSVAPTAIRVVTWNIAFGHEIERAARALTTTEELSMADIVLLQEMDELGSETIARAVGMNHVFASSGRHSRTGRHFGNAVLSRWPVRDPEIVVLPHKSAVQGQRRIAVRVTVVLGDIDIDACSVHTEVPSLSPAKRRRQFDEVVEATRRWTPDRLVIGGDFNTLTRRGVDIVRERMRRVGAEHVSAGAGSTLRRGGRQFALDHVFARGVSPLAAGVVDDATASDHQPLWVHLAL